jgi:DNA repair exonuclease SbcCD nuclease subunit
MDFVESIISQTIDYSKAVGKKEIYCLGDIFESRKSQTLEILKCFERILNMLHSEGMVMKTISGNHDKTDYSSKESFLDSFKWHPAFILHQTFHRELKEVEGGFIAIDFMPFFEDEVWIQELRKGVNAETPKEKGVIKRYLMTHIGIDGVEVKGRVLNGIPKNLITPYYDKVYIGHYHDKNEVDERIKYIGATLQHDFGEKGGKGLTEINLESGDFKTIELESMKWETVEINLDEENDIEILDFINYKDSMTSLRVSLRGREEKIRNFPKNLLIESGIKVEAKVEIPKMELVKGENRELTLYYEDKEIKRQFDFFCQKSNFSEEDKKIGEFFLNKILN